MSQAGKMWGGRFQGELDPFFATFQKSLTVDRVLVLDFKTDRPPPTDAAAAPDSYVMQLALYREVLRKIFPGKTVSCALLWTEKPHLMELPDSRLDAVFATFA